MNEGIDEWRLIEGNYQTPPGVQEVCRAVELEQWENRRLKGLEYILAFGFVNAFTTENYQTTSEKDKGE